MVDKVYVRINGGPFEFGDGIELGTYPNELRIVTPTNTDPDIPYEVDVYVDFISADITDPIQPGQIVECVAAAALDVTEFNKIWYGGE